jgi:hypothetical protein
MRRKSLNIYTYDRRWWHTFIQNKQSKQNQSFEACRKLDDTLTELWKEKAWCGKGHEVGFILSYFSWFIEG